MTEVEGLKQITLFLGGVPTPVDETHPAFGEIEAGLNTLTPQEFRDLLNTSRQVQKKLAQFGNIKVEDGQVFYKGEIVHNLLADRMLQMLEEGRDIRAWALFMENLMQNPAKHAVDELYLWMERANMPITERGNFLAYKKVQDDYTSYHRNPDGTPFRNDIGTFVSMPRNKVDDNRNRTCSSGLHFCSWDYLPSYMGNRGRVVVVEVNPAHVVSIPSDYNNAKGRAEGYLIVGEIPESEARHAFTSMSIAGYDTSDYITYDQQEEIDYSDIEDNWFSKYEGEEVDELEEAAYQFGFTQGLTDARDKLPYDEADALCFVESSNDIEFDDFVVESFYNGYADAYYIESTKMDIEDQTVALKEQAAYDAGFQQGAYDANNKLEHNAVKAVMEFEETYMYMLTFEEETEYCKGYYSGYDSVPTQPVAVTIPHEVIWSVDEIVEAINSDVITLHEFLLNYGPDVWEVSEVVKQID